MQHKRCCSAPSEELHFNISPRAFITCTCAHKTFSLETALSWERGKWNSLSSTLLLVQFVFSSSFHQLYFAWNIKPEAVTGKCLLSFITLQRDTEKKRLLISFVKLSWVPWNSVAFLHYLLSQLYHSNLLITFNQNVMWRAGPKVVWKIRGMLVQPWELLCFALSLHHLQSSTSL